MTLPVSQPHSAIAAFTNQFLPVRRIMICISFQVPYPQQADPWTRYHFLTVWWIYGIVNKIGVSFEFLAGLCRNLSYLLMIVSEDTIYYWVQARLSFRPIKSIIITYNDIFLSSSQQRIGTRIKWAFRSGVHRRFELVLYRILPIVLHPTSQWGISPLPLSWRYDGPNLVLIIRFVLTLCNSLCIVRSVRTYTWLSSFQHGWFHSLQI